MLLRRAYHAIGGLKTLVACAGVFVLGLADFYDQVDIRGLLEYYVGSDRAGTVMMFLSLLFGAMRYFFTNGPAFGRRPRDDDDDDDEDDGYDVDKSRRRYQQRGRH